MPTSSPDQDDVDNSTMTTESNAEMLAVRGKGEYPYDHTVDDGFDRVQASEAKSIRSILLKNYRTCPPLSRTPSTASGEGGLVWQDREGKNSRDQLRRPHVGLKYHSDISLRRTRDAAIVIVAALGAVTMTIWKALIYPSPLKAKMFVNPDDKVQLLVSLSSLDSLLCLDLVARLS
jgi:hypothetical protein